MITPWLRGQMSCTRHVSFCTLKIINICDFSHHDARFSPAPVALLIPFL
jgi:hypothetical protein